MERVRAQALRRGCCTAFHPRVQPRNAARNLAVATRGPRSKRARAIALLSDFGRGFKTKVLEAILAGCYVIVTPKLFKRTPPDLQPFCFPIPRGSAKSFEEALERCMAPFPEHRINDQLREQAYRIMDELLNLKPLEASGRNTVPQYAVSNP